MQVTREHRVAPRKKTDLAAVCKSGVERGAGRIANISLSGALLEPASTSTVEAGTAKPKAEGAPGTPRMHQVQRTWSPYDLLPGGARARLRSLWSRAGFSAEFGTLLRYELDMLLLRIGCALSASHRRRVRDLRQRFGLKVHLGCGNNLKPGWLNLDCYPPPKRPGMETLVLDLRRGLSLADGSTTVIYSEHFLEHIPLQVVRATLLPECHRVLASGGAIRLGVPDGEFYINGYMSRRSVAREPLYEQYLGDQLPMMWINHVARSSAHQYLYDYETLEYLFREAGFVELRRGKANDSEQPDFAGADLTGEGREDATVYIEGRKP